MPSLEFHEEIQQYAEQNDGDDDRPAHRVTQSERYAAGNKKDDDKGIGEETENTEQRSEARLLHQAIWAILAQSPLRLVGSQPRRTRLQLLKQVAQGPLPDTL